MKPRIAALSDAGSPSQNKRSPRRLWILLLILAAFVPLALGLLPVFAPDTSAAVADQLRVWFGPQPVAEIESVSFQIQDWINQIRYQTGNQPAQLTWEPSAGATPNGLQSGSDGITGSTADSTALNAPPSPDASPTIDPSTPATDVASTTEVATATPQTLKQTSGKMPGANSAFVVTPTPVASMRGWQAFGPTLDASPVLSRTVLYPDPARPYAQAAVVSIDLTRTTLHLLAGTVEPIAPKGTAPFPRPGRIPLDVQASGSLIAGFNGGFKAINGQYGMLADGVTILPPQDNLATVAIYSDGNVRMGAWGRDIRPTPDLVAFRQNCPLLVDSGSINPAVTQQNPREWGYTVRNMDTTWRSGFGISADGKTLYYAVGASLTVQSLARALQSAGAYFAMQLDINPVFTRFVTYRRAGPNTLVADKLLSQMAGTSTQFLSPDDRDFFYIAAR